MPHYNCYIVKADRSIAGRHDIEADNDADAMAKASLIDAPTDAPTIEVWKGATLVGRLAQPDESA